MTNTLGENRSFGTPRVPQTKRLHASDTSSGGLKGAILGAILGAGIIGGGSYYLFPEIKDQLTYSGMQQSVQQEQTQNTQTPTTREDRETQGSISQELFGENIKTYQLSTEAQHPNLPASITYTTHSKFPFTLAKETLESSPGVKKHGSTSDMLESRLQKMDVLLSSACEQDECHITSTGMANLIHTWHHHENTCLGNTEIIGNLIKERLPGDFYGGKKQEYIETLEKDQEKYCH